MIKAGSMRIEMGETVLDVIDKLNPLLDRFGLVLQSDGLPHDGYEIVELIDQMEEGGR